MRYIVVVSARPIANTDVLCFGPSDLPTEQVPAGALHPRCIANGVIAGIEDYGNKMGIPTVNGAIFESEANNMIIARDIEVYSMCEHHLLPFIGKCHVAYIPTGKVLGLSKVARIVDMYARRLQVQERLTVQIAQTIQDKIQPRGVGVVIEAMHFCMVMRGVEKQNSVAATSCMLGAFRDHQPTRVKRKGESVTCPASSRLLNSVG